MYLILYLDAIVVKVRADHHVVNKACHLAMDVDVEGASMCWACAPT